MVKRVYPKEGEKKLKQTIKELKSELRKERKRNKILIEEFEKSLKPRRVKKKIEAPRTEEEWREDFLRRFKANVKKREEREQIPLKDGLNGI